ncbi:MAG: hypothetical protein WA485_15240 [Candidatus Sulfotelmatobacter sp.]
MVIHKSYHFQFFDHVPSLPSLVEKHQQTSPDSDQRVVYQCNRRTRGVPLQPKIG